MPPTQPFLVYRDRIGVPSEVEFLRRQYIGFTRLHPIWIGRTILPNAPSPNLRLGGHTPLGVIRRLLFRHLQYAPPLPRRDLAPIIHAQFARGGALALPLANQLDAKLAVTLHGGDITKEKNWSGTVLAQRWPALVQRTAQFICVSHAVANAANARGIPANKLTILPIGVEIPSTPPANHPESHLFVGRFVEKKGIAILAQAMRILRAQGDLTPLVCVGDGPMRPVLMALTKELPGITLTGWLPPEAVQAQMRQAVSLVVPSIIATGGDAEGLPSVIPEAMAQGCPIIGSNQGGIAEAVTNNQTGLLVPPNDPVALAAAMHQLAIQPEHRIRLAAAGYAHARTNLNAAIQSAKLEALLLSL